MNDDKIEAIRERWIEEGLGSDLGLWWLADDVRELLGDKVPEEGVRSVTLEILRPLLQSGKLRAVTLVEGGKFELWVGDVDQQLARIADGWRSVGRPDIGDVVWLIGQRS